MQRKARIILPGIIAVALLVGGFMFFSKKSNSNVPGNHQSMLPTMVKATKDKVIALLKDGDIAGLSAYFDEEVTIDLPDVSDDFNQTEASKVLNEFFNDRKPSDFELLHESASRAGDQLHLIGNLIIDNVTYRTSVLLKSDKILAIEIEEGIEQIG